MPGSVQRGSTWWQALLLARPRSLGNPGTKQPYSRSSNFVARQERDLGTACLQVATVVKVTASKLGERVCEIGTNKRLVIRPFDEESFFAGTDEDACCWDGRTQLDAPYFLAVIDQARVISHI